MIELDRSTLEEDLTELEQKQYEISMGELLLLNGISDELFSTLESRISEFYGKYSNENGVVTYADARKMADKRSRRTRLSLLLSGLDNLISTAFSDYRPLFQDTCKKIVASENEFFSADVDYTKILDKHFWDDANWSTLLAVFHANFLLNFEMFIKQSVLKRETFQGVMRGVKKQHGTMERSLKRHIITAYSSYSSLARHEIFKKNGIKSYVFRTRTDEKTCEKCAPLNGLVFPVSSFEIGVNASPIHRHCRCWEVPILD